MKIWQKQLYFCLPQLYTWELLALASKITLHDVLVESFNRWNGDLWTDFSFSVLDKTPNKIQSPSTPSSINMADDRATAPTNLIKKKSTTPGVVYLSRLPQSMNPTKIRRIFSMYGEVGRLFLQREGMKTYIFFLCNLFSPSQIFK